MKGKKRHSNKVLDFFWDIRNNKGAYTLLLPAMIYTIVFGYFTFPYMIIAFQKFDYRKGIFSDWVGLKNFEFFFKSTVARQVTVNTLFLNFLFISIGTVSAIALALLLNEVFHRKLLKIVQSTYLFPNFLSWVIVSYILYALLSSDNGLVNNVLISMGKEPIRWYAKANVWPAILTVISVWKGVGMSAIVYMAALAGIDSSLYESAQIDGAKRWQQIRYITLPLLLPTVIILTLIAVGKIFYGDFGMIYALIGDNGQLLPTTDIIDTYVFRTLRLTGNPSQAMAVGLYQSFVGFLMVFGSNWLVKKFYPDGALF